MHKLYGTFKRFLDGSFLGLCAIAIKLWESSEALLSVDPSRKDRDLFISLC